ARRPRRRFDRRRLGIERQRHAAALAHLRELRFDERAPLLEAQLADQELHPIALLVLVVAQAMEHAQDRLADREQLAGGQELEERRARAAQDRGAAADRDPEAAP